MRTIIETRHQLSEVESTSAGNPSLAQENTSFYEYTPGQMLQISSYRGVFDLFLERWGLGLSCKVTLDPALGMLGDVRNQWSLSILAHILLL